MLLFKKRFLEAIRRGEKTQTIRLWKFRRMKTGQRSYIPGIGYIRIDAVDQVELDRLTQQDAVLDGFPSVDELLAEIDRLYPAQQRDGHQAYRILLSLLTPEVQGKKSVE